MAIVTDELSRLLGEARAATGEPVFGEALSVLAAVGFNDLDGDPVKRLQAIRTRMLSADAVAAVEHELARQARLGERISKRRACERVAASLGIEAPSLEAGRKRVSRAYQARNEPRASGDTGRKLLVGKVRAGAGERGSSRLVIRDLAWVADDRATRLAVSCGELVVIEGRDPKSQEHASRPLAQLAQLIRDGKRASQRLDDRLAAKGLIPPEAEHGAHSRPPRKFARQRQAYDKGFERAEAQDPAFGALADQVCEGLCAQLKLAGRGDRAAMEIASGRGSKEEHRALALAWDENERLFGRGRPGGAPAPKLEVDPDIVKVRAPRICAAAPRLTANTRAR